MTNFYLTTTLPYVNAKPHLGFAWEILTADFICRYHRLLGDEVCFNTGTDEHGQKVWQKALENNLTPQAYADLLVKDFENLKSLLDLSITNFIRTTDKHHIQAAQEMWRRCFEKGDIYKQEYETKYCVGCELEKTDSELVNGRCELHPNLELEIRREENYFFRFSKYGEKLLALYEAQPDFVRGQGKMAEIKSFVAHGLKDFSISRVKSKMPWGIPVPGDDEQVMYVWFDALTNYVSTLGWPNENSDYEKFWPGVQICGKDNLRQQAAIWQAMLISAGLPNSQNILVDGFIMIDGQKMSKSLGNVIEPRDLVEKYGVEATRFLLATLTVLDGDADISASSLHDIYTSELVNGLGNLCSRLAKMAESVELGGLVKMESLDSEFMEFLDNYQTNKALEIVRGWVNNTDKYLSANKPWALEHVGEKRRILQPALETLLQIAYHLQIFLPQTSEKIIKHFTAEKIAAFAEPLFPRLSL